MIRRWVINAIVFVVACLAPLAAARAAGEPFVRVEVETPQPVAVGQQVKINISVFVPNYFLSAPQFPLFDLPGAVVTLPDQGSLNLNDTIGGESFAGIQRTYVITPQQAGALTLPPAHISFTYAATPGQRTDGSLTLPPQAISVRIPPGAEGALLASDLRMTQSLDRDPAGLKIGDTLMRTIVIAASGIQAMMIPPPVFAPVDGVTLYPQQPVLQDESRDRAGLVGATRTDKMVYRFDRPGDYLLPALTVDWFDPFTGKRARASAPEVSAKVATTAAFKTEIAPDIPVPAEPAPGLTASGWIRLVATAVSIIGIATLATLLFPRCRRAIMAWRARQRETEAAYFARLHEACHGNDRKAVYRAIDAWTRRAGALSASDWVRQNGSDELRRSFGDLEREMFGSAPETEPWQAKPLLSALIASRRTWLHQKKPQARALSALPALNP
jgi:hypothetical protein